MVPVPYSGTFSFLEFAPKVSFAR